MGQGAPDHRTRPATAGAEDGTEGDGQRPGSADPGAGGGVHRPGSARRRRRAAVLFAFLIASLAVCGAAHLAWRSAARERAAWADGEARDRATALRRSVEHIGHDLEVLRAVVEADGPDRRRWATFAEHVLSRAAYTRALEWVPAIPASERGAFERAARLAGSPSFAVRERGPDGGLVPAGARSVVYPVVLVAPLAGNEAAIGFDIGSQASRRAALERATDRGEVAITEPVALPRELGGQRGFFALMPVYAPGVEATVASRRSHLRGFVLGTYAAAEFLERSLGPSPTGETGVRLFDALLPAEEGFLGSHPARPVEAASGAAAQAVEGTRLVEIADRQWQVIFRGEGGASGGASGLVPWVILVGGLLVNALVAAYVLLVLDRAGQARSDARVLGAAKASLEAQIAERVLAEAQTRAVLESAHDGILLLDEAGRVGRMNAAAESAFGWTAGEAAGKSFLETLVAPGSRAAVARALVRPGVAPEPAPVSDVETLGLRRDGTTFPMECRCTFILDGRGASTAAFIRDLTASRRLELELRQAQKLEAVGQLSAGVAHELNTPIQFIGDNTRFLGEAFADLTAFAVLARDHVRPEAAAAVEEKAEAVELEYLREQVPRTVERTLAGVERVATIVRAMREFAHPDQKLPTAVDLNRALQATLEIARNEYKYVAEVETDLGDLPAVTCRGGDLNQVFLNLLVNAAHAIEEKVKGTAARGRIRISSRRDREAVLITFSDDGAGIPAAARQRIFEPFFTTKPVGRGTGQGLAIARAIVAAHRGTIWFETTEGAGTAFHVRIPLGLDHRDLGGSEVQPV